MPRYPAAKAPPSCENISIELAQQVLTETWGNIAQAADALGVPSRDFRLLVRTTPALAGVAEEAGELYCDKAEGILRGALESENELRRDVAARFVLSGKGAPRGWTRPSGPAVTIEQQPSRQIVIKWLGEDESAPRQVSEGSPALIDATPIEGDDRPSEQIEPVGGSVHTRGTAAAAPPAVLIEHRDAIVPEPVAPTPTLPVWPGPYPPPPLVAHLYAPYTPVPRIGLRPRDHCRRETRQERG